MNRLQTRMRIFTDSLFASKKNQTLRRNFISTIFFIVLAFVVLILFYLALGCSPSVFGQIFSLAFVDPDSYLAPAVRYFCIFAMAALSFGFAMKNGIFNIGVSGQMLAGATVSFLIISKFQDKWHPAGGQIITILISVIVAMLIALLIGTLKVYLRIHEVVTGILLNWILLFISGELIKTFFLDDAYWSLGTLKSKPMDTSFSFSQYGNYGWAWSLGVTLISIFVVFILLKYTVFGHKIKTVGLSLSAAKYYGYNANVLNLSSFAISGLLAGLLGVIVYTGVNSHAINFNGTSLDSVPQEGFNGIAVSMIALNNPIGILFVAILFGLFNTGTDVYLNTPTQNFAFGMLMYFVAIYAVLNFFKPWLWFAKSKYHLDEINKYKKFQGKIEDLCQDFVIKKSANHSAIVEAKVEQKIREWKQKYLLKFYYAFDLKDVINDEQLKFILTKVSNNPCRRSAYWFRRFFYSIWFGLNKFFSKEQKEVLLQKMIQHSWKEKKYYFLRFLYTICFGLSTIFSKNQRKFVGELADQYARKRSEVCHTFLTACVSDVIKRWNSETDALKIIDKVKYTKWYQLKPNFQWWKIKREVAFVVKTVSRHKIALTDEMMSKLGSLKKAIVS